MHTFLTMSVSESDLQPVFLTTSVSEWTFASCYNQP